MDEFACKARLFGLLVECPFGETLTGCPLNEFRSDNLHDIERWIFHDLTSDQLSILLDAHELCACLRDLDNFSEKNSL